VSSIRVERGRNRWKLRKNICLIKVYISGGNQEKKEEEPGVQGTEGGSLGPPCPPTL